MTGEAPGPWVKEAERHKRAMPIARLVGSGMDYADAAALHAAVDAGQPWAEAARALGDANRSRAGEAASARSQGTWHFAAAACYRFGQVPLVDSDPLKRELIAAMVSEYGTAAPSEGVSRLEIAFRDGMLSGWLRGADRDSDVPVVLIVGGFDGWREEYDLGARALEERGVASCLIEVPGQSEARVLRGMAMDADPDETVAAVDAFISALRERGLTGPIGIWGNSMGGYLAARAGSLLDSIRAVCVNSGSDRPAEILDRFARFSSKIELMFAEPDPERARRLAERMVLRPEMLAGLHSPLLVLHGTPDRVFLVSSGRRILEAAGSDDKSWCEWADGDHCIYNHTQHKHTIVGDWFADRLGGKSSISSLHERYF